MRPQRRSLILPFLLCGFSTSVLAQQQNLTDVQRVDLGGSVKSVSTETTRTDVVWSQPGGPALVIPIWCQECEFDPNGNRTKFGQMIDGRFQGETVHFLSDGQGHVTERIGEDASTGQTIRREVVGPFGNTEESYYRNGELQSRTLFSYDQYGHRIDELTLDGSGKQQFHTVVNTDKDGNDTERWDWGKEGELSLHFRQNVDPKTQTEQFTSFDAYGSVKLTWTLKDRKLSSYWQLPGSPSCERLKNLNLVPDFHTWSISQRYAPPITKPNSMKTKSSSKNCSFNYLLRVFSLKAEVYRNPLRNLSQSSRFFTWSGG